MQSIGNMMNNPTKVNEVDINLTNISAVRNVIEISKENYENITKDPYTLYMVTDTLGNNTLYLGELSVKKINGPYPRYVMGPQTNSEYVIYAVYQWRELYWMTPVERYKDAITAVSVLDRLNNGGLYTASDRIHELLVACLQGNITVNDFIILTIGALGYDGPTVSALASVVNDEGYGKGKVINGIKMLSETLVAELPKLAYNFPTSMFPTYNVIYNVLVAHNVLWSNKYINDPTNVDMHDVIDDIINETHRINHIVDTIANKSDEFIHDALSQVNFQD